MRGDTGLTVTCSLILLATVFIGLKFCEVISWSWWWVLCPLWGGLIAFLVLTVVALVWIERITYTDRW